jgi:hypothetical protein
VEYVCNVQFRWQELVAKVRYVLQVTENDYLCLVIKLLLEVEHLRRNMEVKFYANSFSSVL